MNSLRRASALASLLWTLGASFAALADGGVALGVTTLLQSGDPGAKVDITFIGDGFTEDQQEKFNDKVDDLVEELMETHPFFPLRSAFNIHRVNVGSPQSGTDKFAKCGDEDIQDDDDLKETALDTGFCAGGTGAVNRCVISSDPTEVFNFAAASPDDEHIIVLVNESQRGGCASGGIGYLTLSSDFGDVFVHELGHSLFGLADEYEYDSDQGTYAGAEPGSVNVTTRVTKETLVKWNDMILESTPVPTEDDQDCDSKTGSSPGFPLDLIGSYEGARYHRCAIYRPQPDCKMRHSDEAFCSVCRRKIIRDLADALNTEQSVRLSHLLIRDDHDPWPKGSGEIFIKYTLKTGLETQEGYVPNDDSFSMDDGDSRDLDNTLGLLRAEGPGGAPNIIEFRVREDDTFDDDEVDNDHDHTVAGTGAFEVDEEDWRIRGEVQDAPLVALFDAVGIKDDHEPWIAGDADVYVNYTVSNGTQTVGGRWPASGDSGVAQDSGRNTGAFMAALPEPAADGTLRLTFKVMDADGWFTGDDDTIGEDTFEFNAAELFGTQQVTHQRDGGDYRVTFSLFRPATAGGVFDRGPDLIPEPLGGAGNPLAFCRRDGSNLVVRVRNQGNEPAVVSTATRVEFAAGNQTTTTPPVFPGAAADVIVPIPSGCFRPDCSFTIRVDADNSVQEIKHNANDTSHEDNNMALGTCLG